MKAIKRPFLILIALFILVSSSFTVGCDDNQDPTDTNSSESASETAPIAPTQFRSSELEKYVIVYSADNPDYYKLALKLKNQISEKYGKKVSTSRDTKAEPSYYEILLGDTNRYDTQSKVMEYSVTVDGGRFIINVGGSVSAEEALSYLCDNVFNGQDLALDSGEYYKKSLLTSSAPLTDGTTARIMSANLLADKFSNGAFQGAYYRAEIFAGMLVAYSPDILGLQETDENWNKILDGYLARLKNAHGISYARHWGSFEGKVNYTSLLYRSDKFKVDDGGVEVFTWWNKAVSNQSYHMRNIAWAQFSSLENADKSFIVANTHWSYRTELADGKTYLAGSDAPVATNELRMQCKDETNTIMTSLKQSHSNIPIFLTGDFNTSLTYFTQSNWGPESYRVISEEAKNNGTSLSDVPTANHFDHIFGAGSYTVARYEFFNNTNRHALLSDHPFVYADLIF